MADYTFKILVTGPFAAGKTSLIQSVSQTPVVTTEVATTGDESAVKANTTVAMDFGTFTLSADADGLGEFSSDGYDDASYDAIDDDGEFGSDDTITLLLFG
ncbi:MAG TPA: hypothetical protein PLV68_19675, partial [Ilumatobacteraceae bacterium]|nr:hypothetical protein [Ilumatobacteraceae bacterium]